MQLEVVPRLLRAFVGVAVLAAVQAGVVCADVAAFDAVAARAQSLVLQFPELADVRRAQNRKRCAARTVDAEARIVAVRAARLDVDAVFFRDAAQDFGEAVLVVLGKRNQFRHVHLELLVHLHE